MHRHFLVLNGINGSNPLGFLATIGTLSVASRFRKNARLSWNVIEGAWRPLLWNCYADQTSFLEELFSEIEKASMDVFRLEKKFPYESHQFLTHLRNFFDAATFNDHRSVNFLAAFGSEILTNKGKKDLFASTDFCMVRSGDSAGQGLLSYANAINEDFKKDKECLNRALFETWDYKDEGYSLRWDPSEDQRYALRWDDPSPAKKKTMLGANRLALEALPLFPSVPVEGKLRTTGFNKTKDREVYFTWPIWSCELSLYSVRSLLSLAELYKEKPDRIKLEQMGIQEVFRCQRISTRYYKNFLPAAPI
ncbi:MAG TPA: hypothetical protein PLM29_06230 [Deltaproteobacteria bacterium]|nr:hypothetical protein [Deltaproteobacteria bacterium]HPR52847.1 hypothetical protein [Deltaproteobacteria bacterium]